MALFSRKIPIRISPFFWLTAGLIGWLNGRNLILMIIWIFVIFISVLVHELGHALTMRFFKRDPQIELVAFGGMTYQGGRRLRGWREFLVILNGPLAGFFLFLCALFLLSSGWFQWQVALAMLEIFVLVNLFWSFVNLLPIMPLDGGQLLRVICESVSPIKGLRSALFLSMLFSAFVTCYSFFYTRYLIFGVIFCLFTFQNFVSWKQTRIMTARDQDDDLAAELKNIEALLANNQRQLAISKLEEIRSKAKQGLIFNTTTQYLATLRAQENNYSQVYQLLIPIQKHLSGESVVHLHRSAYEMGDYPLVFELAGSTFQLSPKAEIALRNAEASASMKLAEPTIGWLKAARKCGIDNLKVIVEKESFSPIRDLPSFRNFLQTL